jgi:chromosome segregation ATPase
MMETNNELVALNKELSHDLEKLKRDSFERIKELQNQVDEHREAAATARGEANAAKSTADFERQRYERLSEQYNASQRDVHALTEKNSGLTRQNATHEEFIRNQSASLRDAEERARNAHTQLSQLESSTQLLRSEQKRLSEIVAAADEVKAKLESSRDAALSLSTTREEEHKRTHERLTVEVARLQQDYSRVRSELDIERERGRQQLAAHAAANSELAQRAKTDDDVSAKLKADTAAAERRADVAEAKLEMMEVTLSKTEEKLRLASRMTGSAETNVIGASSGAIPCRARAGTSSGCFEGWRSCGRSESGCRGGKEAHRAIQAACGTERFGSQGNDQGFRNSQGAKYKGNASAEIRVRKAQEGSC